MKYGYFLCLLLLFGSCTSARKYRQGLVECNENLDTLVGRFQQYQAETNSFIDRIRPQLLRLNEQIKFLEAQNHELKMINIELENSKYYSDTLEIKLTVTADLKYYLGQSELEFDSVKSRLVEQHSQSEKKDELLIVVLKMDKDLTVGEMVRIMNFCAENKIRMVLATDKETK